MTIKRFYAFVNMKLFRRFALIFAACFDIALSFPLVSTKLFAFQLIKIKWVKAILAVADPTQANRSRRRKGGGAGREVENEFT